MKRFGQVIRLKPGVLQEYKKFHAAVWPEVARTITACHIRNYSIFHRDGYLFAYFEYTGADYMADMERMAADPKTQEWWAIMKPMQDPVSSHSKDEWWADMEECFHQD